VKYLRSIDAGMGQQSFSRSTLSFFVCASFFLWISTLSGFKEQPLLRVCYSVIENGSSLMTTKAVILDLLGTTTSHVGMVISVGQVWKWKVTSLSSLLLSLA
jgi:maltodextrin utilization protein YvdJ